MTPTAIFAIIGIAQCAYLFFLVFRLSHNLEVKLGLSVLVLSHTLLLLSSAFNELDGYEQFPHFLYIRVPAVLLIGPSLFFLFRGIFSKQAGNLKVWWHLLPFLAYVVVMMPYFTQDASVKLSAGPHDFVLINFLWLEHFKVAHLLAYLIWVLLLFRSQSFRPKVAKLMSPYRRLFYWMLIIYACIICVSVLGAVLLYFDVQFMVFSELITIILTTALAYAISFVFVKRDAEWARLSNYTNENSITDQGLSVRLEQYMKTEKPYLQGNIKVDDLAIALGVPASSLSGFLNQHLEMSFADYINGYRLEEFKRRVVDPSEDYKTILGIAYESGFNSKTSFQRIFKEQTGLTPSAYRNAQLKEVPK